MPPTESSRRRLTGGQEERERKKEASGLSTWGEAMKKGKGSKGRMGDTRRRAEEFLRQRPEDIQIFPGEDIKKLIHELQVHQIELEMQNEELRKAQVELEESRTRYFDLYDLAPIGYFTFNRKGMIVEVNLTGADLLGVERRHLIKRGFSQFIARDYQDAFYFHRNLVFESKTRQSCELKLMKSDGTSVYAHLESVAVEDPSGTCKQCRTTVSDITKRKYLAQSLQASYNFLDIANRHTKMSLLLGEFVAELKKVTGCAAVGIRLLDANDNIPYQAYDGFSQRFYEMESPLSIRSDQCMCTNVIRGMPDPALPFYTEGGSFYMNGATRFLATVSEKEKGEIRNVCDQLGYESVAVVPIRSGNRIVGLVHLADQHENMVPLESVRMWEWAAMQLGTAIERVQAAEALQQTHDELERRVKARTGELVIGNEQLKREIAERQEAAEALRQSEARYRAMFEHNPIRTIVVDLDGKIMAANLAISKSDDKLPHIGDVMYKDYAGKHEIDMHAELLKCMKSQTLAEFPELRYRKKILCVRIAPFSEGAVITAEDITPRKRSEDRILRQNVLLEAINRLFRESWRRETSDEVVQLFLTGAVELTGSQVGFTGEVDEAGRFDLMALTDAGGSSRRWSRSDAVAVIQDPEVRGYWDRAIREGQSFIVQDVVGQPDRGGNPDGRPKGTSLLGVALQDAGKTFGIIGLANKESGYDVADRQAVENLGMAFMETLNRKRTEEHARMLSQELLKTQEMERKQLACDLHDNLAQDLAALKIGLHIFLDDQPGNPVENRGRASELSGTVQRIIMAVRNIAHELYPASLEQLGLVMTLRRYCEEFSKRTGHEVDFASVGLEAIELDFDTKIALYRLIQESLNNIRKHADASQVTIRLAASYPHIMLRIEDNGKGFEVEKRLDAALRERRMGLWSMRQRVAHLRGELEIESRPTKGTKIQVRVPYMEKSDGRKENHLDC
jgi:PAS domain S-box-containing protein